MTVWLSEYIEIGWVIVLELGKHEATSVSVISSTLKLHMVGFDYLRQLQVVRCKLHNLLCQQV